MAPQETSTRARQDSGLIDLIAIDREARERNAAREAEEARARSEVPPVMHDLSAAEDDVDAFAQSMATPWSRLAKLDRRSKIAAAAGAALLAIGIAILSVGGSSSDPAKTAAASAPPPPSTALPANIPPPPPVTPAPAPAAESPARNAIATRVEATDKTKAKKPAASAPRKSSGKAGRGPKLMKVQSSGV